MPQATSTTPDLMGIVSRQITPDVIRSAASQLSEDRTSTATALTTAVPSVLTALSDVASSDRGARHLKDVIDETRLSTPPVDEDRSLFRSSTTPAGDHAATLIDDELGPRSSSIAAAVAGASGIKTTSAHKLMSGVATVAVAALAKSSGGLGAGALQSLFREQRGRWVSRLPGPVAALFNGHGRPMPSPTERYDYERTVTGPGIREMEAPRRSWVFPAILVALVLLAIPLLRGLRRPVPARLPPAPRMMRADLPPPGATPPVGTTPAREAKGIEPGSVEDMAAFLSERGEVTPQVFAPAPLTFGVGSAKPTPDSMKTIDEIADVLKAHPSATIRVESHTDDVGSQAANLELSAARAEAIKNELVDRGADASKIETAGIGQELPIAGNDTAEGRARNRRSEIVVTGR